MAARDFPSKEIVPRLVPGLVPAGDSRRHSLTSLGTTPTPESRSGEQGEASCKSVRPKALDVCRHALSPNGNGDTIQYSHIGRVAELADARDLKSRAG